MPKAISLTEKILSTNLRSLRILHEYTLKQIGEELSVGPSTVSRYERAGPRFVFPQPEAIDKLASIYGVKIADLFSPLGAKEKRTALRPAVEDAVYILNNYLNRAGFHLRQTKPTKIIKLDRKKKQRARARALKKNRSVTVEHPLADRPKEPPRDLRLSLKEMSIDNASLLNRQTE